MRAASLLASAAGVATSYSPGTSSVGMAGSGVGGGGGAAVVAGQRAHVSARPLRSAMKTENGATSAGSGGP